MKIEINNVLLSPASERELLVLCEENLRQANYIRHCLAKSAPIVIERNGQPDKERALAVWIKRKGGYAVLADCTIQFDAPYLGRGGES